ELTREFEMREGSVIHTAKPKPSMAPHLAADSPTTCLRTLRLSTPARVQERIVEVTPRNETAFTKWLLVPLARGDLPSKEDILGLAALHGLYQDKSQLRALQAPGCKEYGVQICTPCGRCYLNIFYETGKVYLAGTHPQRGVPYLRGWAVPDLGVSRAKPKARDTRWRAPSPDKMREQWLQKVGGVRSFWYQERVGARRLSDSCV
ncbi:unnamed protein product, partial [Polarella glacialis]